MQFSSTLFQALHSPRFVTRTCRYVAIYKKKTTEIYTDNKYAIDGCATFFRRDRWVELLSGRSPRGAWGGAVRRHVMAIELVHETRACIACVCNRGYQTLKLPSSQLQPQVLAGEEVRGGVQQGGAEPGGGHDQPAAEEGGAQPLAQGGGTRAAVAAC